MKQIQKLTVRTPRTVQIAFLLILILPLLVMYGIGKASASPLNCTEIYFADKMGPVDLKDYPQCKKKFQYLTRMRIKQFNNYK